MENIRTKEKKRISLEGKRFRIKESGLNEEDGIIRWRDRTFIPKELRGEQMTGAHNGHKRSRTMALDMVDRKIWWPHWRKDIDMVIDSCESCLKAQLAKTSAPPVLVDTGIRSWACLTSDFF